MTAPIPSIATIPIATVGKVTTPIPSIPTIPVATAIVRKVTIPIAVAIVPIASAVVSVVARTGRRGDEARANNGDRCQCADKQSFTHFILLSPLLVCLARARCAKVLKVDRGKIDKIGTRKVIPARQLEHAGRGVMS
jgi:hypothetical protein